MSSDELVFRTVELLCMADNTNVASASVIFSPTRNCGTADNSSYIKENFYINISRLLVLFSMPPKATFISNLTVFNKYTIIKKN
jgi:hypothetical protein